MTIEEFGKTIKSKYPQYGDMSDNDLGQKVLSKYPQYQDMIDSPTMTEKFLNGHSVLRGISDALGTTGLGKGIAQSIFLKFTPEGKDVQSLISQGKLKASALDEILGQPATSQEVAGSAVQTAISAGSAGIGPSTARTAIGRIGQTAATISGISGISGGAKAFGEGAQAPEIVKAARRSAITGGILGGAGQAIGELATLLSSPSVTEGIYNKYLGIPKKVIEKGRSPSEMLIKEGVTGTKKSILSQSEKIANESEKKVANLLKNNTESFTSSEIVGNIESAIQEKFQNSLSSNEVKRIVQNLPLNALKANKKITINQLNALRSELDNKFLGDAKWLNNSTTERVLGLKTASNLFRSIVQDAVPESAPVFERWSSAIQATRALRSELAKPHALTNILEIMGGLLYGGATGGLSVEGLRNAIAAYGVAKGVTSAPAGTLGAQVLRKTGKIAEISGEIIKPIVSGSAANFASNKEK